MGHSVFIGFGTGGGGGGGADPLLFPLDLYVASTGNDANPGTPALPVLTMNGAWSKVRDLNGNLTYLIGAPIRVHVAAFPAGTLQWTPVPGYQAINATGQVIVYGDGALQGVEDGFTVVGAGAAGVGTTATSVAFAGVADAFLGYTIEFDAGSPAAGQRRLVRNNTDALGTTSTPPNTIVPTAAFSVAPLPGDTFRILMPAASINLTAGSVDIQTSADISVTLINLDSDSAGNNFALRALGVSILKLYGCSFSNAARLSLFDTNTYAGTALGQVSENIRLSDLWTALGGVQDWIGWGITSPSNGFSSGVEPFQSFTGYMVSFDGFITGLVDAADSRLFLFGGYVGGIQAAHARIDFRPQTPNPAIPMLLRNTGAVQALYMLECETVVLGGDAALALENPVDGNQITMIGGELTWLGNCTLNAQDISAVFGAIVYLVGGRFKVFGEVLTVNTLGTICANGLIAANGGQLEIFCPVVFNLSAATTGTMQAALLAYDISKILVSSPDISVASTDVTVNSVNPSVYGGLICAANSEILVAGNLNLQSAGVICVSVAQSSIQVIDISAPDSFGGIQIFADARILAGDIGITGEIGVLAINGQLICQSIDMAIAATVPTGGIFALQSVVKQISESGGSISCISPVPTPTIFSVDSEITLGASITGNGAALRAVDNSRVTLNGNLESTEDTAVFTNSGSQVSFGPPINITAALDGVDCTGGGSAVFGQPPAFLVGRNELVVGPGIMEQSPFALALPNAGDSFANAGTGSVMTVIEGPPG